MQGQSWIGTLIVALIGFGGGFFAGARSPNATVAPDGGASASPEAASCYFSPQGGCTQAIVDELAAARHTIELQGYSFTSRPIATALIAAKSRGVDVTLLLDAAATSEHRAVPNEVGRAGIPVYIDARHAIAHNKVILIDGGTLITGSFNFTHAAETDNAENVLVVHGQPKLQSAYEENFRRHLAHAERFDGT